MNTTGRTTRKPIRSLAASVIEDRQSLVSATVSFFLGMCRLTNGINPFGTAMLCAAGNKLNAFFVGAALSSVFAGNMFLPTLAVNSLIFAVRKISERRKPMRISGRVILAGLAAVLLAVTRFLIEPRHFYILAESIVYFAILPLFTVLYMGLSKRDAFLGAGHREAGLLAAAFTLTVVMTQVSIGYFSLGIIWAGALTMLAAKRGMAAGCLTGFVCGLGCFDALLLPMLGLCGLTAGLLFPANRKAAIYAGCGAATVFGALTAELPKFIFTSGCIWIGAGLFLLAEKAGADKLLMPKTSIDTEQESDPRFAKIAESFSTLANVFFNACESASTKTATIVIPLKQCAGCDGCAEHGLDEEENNIKLSQLMRGERKRMPSHFIELCPNADKIEAAAIAAGRHASGSTELKKMAEQYLDFSKIMECVAQREQERSTPMPEKEDAVRIALDKLNIEHGHVSVTGGRRRRVEVSEIAPENLSCTTSELRYELSKAVGTVLSEPMFIKVGDMSVLQMNTIPAINIEYHHTSTAASGERINGDTTAVFESDDGKFYALISDGMGSGPAAASCSRLTAIFLEKLLRMGADTNESIRLLNKLLIAKEGEIFAGVDLVEIDRVNATSTIIKAGAAPTLLIRNNVAHLIQSKTAPAGIIEEITAEQTKIRLRRGDYVLMFSDGIIGGGDKIPLWMLTIIEKGKYSTPGELALKISEGAKRAYGFKDDITTLALKII